MMTLFEPNEPNVRPPLHSKTVEKAMGAVFFLGAAAALIGVIYFLGD
jgi:hypothetical protein